MGIHVAQADPWSVLVVKADLVEGAINDWNWQRSFTLDEVISSVYYKYTHAKKS